MWGPVTNLIFDREIFVWNILYLAIGSGPFASNSNPCSASVLELIAQPVESLVESITRSGASCLDVPVAVAKLKND